MAEPAEALSLDVWLDIGGREMECQPRAGNCKYKNAVAGGTRDGQAPRATKRVRRSSGPAVKGTVRSRNKSTAGLEERRRDTGGNKGTPDKLVWSRWSRSRSGCRRVAAAGAGRSCRDAAPSPRTVRRLQAVQGQPAR